MAQPVTIRSATSNDLEQLSKGLERTFVIESIADSSRFILPDVVKGTVYFDCDVNVYNLCQGLEAGRVVFRRSVRVDNQLGGLGNLMTGGEIIVEGGFDGQSLGSGMKGGYIWIKGNVAASQIGEQMSGGQIHIEGDCRCDGDYGRIGRLLDTGTIHVHGSVTCRRGIRGNPRNPASLHIGVEMKSGEIKVDGNVEGDDDLWLGRDMKKGKIWIQGSALAPRLDVGSGNCRFSTIQIDGQCATGNIGHLLEGGEIQIGGRTRGSIGLGMKQGTIVIRADVEERDAQGYLSAIGAGMTGGRIEIWGNAREFNLGRSGGEIYHHGRPVRRSALRRWLGADY